MRNKKYNYIGCFVDKGKLDEVISYLPRNRLSHEIEDTHVTFEYKPRRVDKSLFGTPIRVTITKYGFDKENEGLMVKLYSEDPRINDMISHIPKPHITLSVSDTGRAVNTRYLDFVDIPEICITGRFGGYCTLKTE